MALKCGIVGLPNVGKSTLFNCLSNAKAQSENFPFCTIDPHVGIMNVPDERLVKLEQLVNPAKLVPTTIEIVDIAGLVKGAHKGEGLGNQFLGNIRETDAIIHVLRCFEDDNVVHVDGSIDPIRDKEVIDIELQLKDLDTVEKRIETLQKNSKSGDKDALKKLAFAEKIKQTLESGNSARTIQPQNELEETVIKDFQLLTSKPILYVCNVDEASVKEGNAHVEKVSKTAAEENAEVMIVGAGIEADIAQLDSIEERQMFLDDLGLEEPGVNRLIKKAYKLLKLQTYFTAGEKEVKAWTVPVGASAPQAAGAIHTDFEKGFIRAEVIKYNDYVQYGSENQVKEAGKMRVEGKDYIVEDGDVMLFRFNV